MATRPWETVVDTAIAMYRSGDYAYFYGAKGMITGSDGKRYPQVLTDPVMDELIRQSPGHFAKFSEDEMQQIRKNSRGLKGVDCSGYTGDCTGDEQWSTGQITNCFQYNTLEGGPTASLLYTTWGGTGRHIGLDIGGDGKGNGWCLQAGYESTDAIVKAGKNGIFLSKISETAWERSGMSRAVNYSGVYSPYGATLRLIEDVYGKHPSTTPKWVAMATTLVNVRTSPQIINDSTGKSRNPLPQYPLLGAGNLVDVCDDVYAPGWYYVRIAGKYYGWVKAEYLVPPTQRDPRVGDKVKFTGSKIYASSYKNGKGITVPGFTAKVIDKNSQAHPYLIKSTGTDGYEGWANKSDLKLV
ncbi:MAG: hypothetical protein IJM76_06065 [Lachnospiraceae bacterium]|nr:hypothetical protein [Lachnospiraceae bacterium]